MKQLLQTLPSLQSWIRDLANATTNDEVESLLGYIEQWVQQARDEFQSDQLKGTIPLLLTEAAVELFNISVCKTETLLASAKARVRSASCSLLEISSLDNDLDNRETWLRIHYFTAAAWHELQEFAQAEVFLKRVDDIGDKGISRLSLSTEVRELIFNIYSLRSDNCWAMDHEREAKQLALQALDYLDKSAMLWFHIKLYNKGVKLYQLSLMEKAEEWFRMSLEALKNSDCQPQVISKRIRTLLVLALTLKSSEKFDEALQTINLGLSYGNNDVDSLYLKTELLIKMKKFDDAAQTLRQTIGHAGCGQKMGIGLCQLLKGAGQHSTCMSGIDELILKYPQSAQLKLMKLRCFLSAEDIENGGLFADQILNDHVSGRNEMIEKDVEEFRNILNSIALHLFEIRLFGTCSEWISRSERLATMGGDNDDKSIYLCRCALSIVEIEQGNTKEALHCALKADHLCPHLSLAKLVAAHCLILLNDPESAKKQLNDAFRSREFDRKYVSIILGLSAKAEFTDCAAICIEELLNCQDVVIDRITLLKCAVDMHYKILANDSESLNIDEKTLKQSLDRLCQHFRSIVPLVQSSSLEAATDSDVRSTIQHDIHWLGKVAWNSGLMASKHNLFQSCSSLFYFSVVLFQMVLGSQFNDFDYQIMVGLCMSATAAMKHISSIPKTAQGAASDLEDLCNFCISRIREFHVAAKAFRDERLLRNLYPIIHIVELELKLTIDDPNVEIHVRSSVDIPGWKPSLFEEVAAVCLKAPFFKRHAAILALQMLLGTEIEQSQQEKATMNIEHVSRTIRHLITLTDNIDSQFPFFEQAKTICISIASTALIYPKLEAQWLVSRSWNNGVMAYRNGNWDSAKDWMSTSIQLLNMLGDSCSANKQEMVKSLAFVLSRVQDRSKIVNQNVDINI